MTGTIPDIIRNPNSLFANYYSWPFWKKKTQRRTKDPLPHFIFRLPLRHLFFWTVYSTSRTVPHLEHQILLYLADDFPLLSHPQQNQLKPHPSLMWEHYPRDKIGRLDSTEWHFNYYNGFVSLCLNSSVTFLCNWLYFRFLYFLPKKMSHWHI